MLVVNIKSDFTFDNFKNFVIRKHMERQERIMIIIII